MSARTTIILGYTSSYSGSYSSRSELLQLFESKQFRRSPVNLAK